MNLLFFSQGISHSFTFNDFQCNYGIKAVGTNFNIFSYTTVLAKYSNPSPPQWQRDALHVMKRLRV